MLTSSSTLKMKKDNFESVLVYLSYMDWLRSGPMSPEDAKEPVRSYDRSWSEIEEMLDKAIARREQWKKWFDQCSKDGDRDGMKEAARNHKALDGVIKTLRWTLGEEGVDHPLDWK